MRGKERLGLFGVLGAIGFACPLFAQQIGTGATEQEATKKPIQLQEVVVTAQKREEHLQDVPVPVSVLEAQELVDSNQVRLVDYYTRIPALTYTPGGDGSATLAIRGLTTG